MEVPTQVVPQKLVDNKGVKQGCMMWKFNLKVDDTNYNQSLLQLPYKHFNSTKNVDLFIMRFWLDWFKYYQLVLVAGQDEKETENYEKGPLPPPQMIGQKMLQQRIEKIYAPNISMYKQKQDES